MERYSSYYSKEYYETVKDDYPVLYIKDLREEIEDGAVSSQFGVYIDNYPIYTDLIWKE